MTTSTGSAVPRVEDLDTVRATALAEGTEAEFMFGLEAAAPPDVQRALGMTQARVGGGVVLVMAHDPTGGYWNKALGFGVTEPVTEELVRDVVGRYRAAGAPAAVLQVAPSVLPEDWEDICARLGISGGQVWAKLLRPAGLPAAPAETDLRTGDVDAASADAWARVFCIGFGMPEEPSLVAMFAQGATADGFRALGAWDGEHLVAGALLHVSGESAAFCGAATLPEARGRGAQSAFMARRVGLAQAAGCAWLGSETWQELGGAHNPSLHNMLRAGFTQVYDRQNWVWRRETD